MEHVADIEMSYGAMAKWLRPGGMMSHQIDLSSHNLTKQWNGYRQYPDWIWRVIEGKRPYLINRATCSEHIELMENNGLEILCCLKRHEEGIDPRPGDAHLGLGGHDRGCGKGGIAGLRIARAHQREEHERTHGTGGDPSHPSHIDANGTPT